MATTSRPARLLLATALVAVLGAGEAIAQPADRARAAQARGDLRTAHIEYRNAVRAEPQNAAVRAGLAVVSLELGDAETAEREARAALERGFDPVAGTGLLVRSYLMRGRFRELLRDFPLVDSPAQPTAGQVASARALAHLALDDREAARAAVQVALRLAPQSPDPHLAAATLAAAEGNREASEAAIDRALAADPASAEALLRKASFQAERGDPAALQTLATLISQAPGNVSARAMRAELLIRSGEEARARQDIDAVLRIVPGHVPANYLTAMLHARAQNWRAADEILQRLSQALPNIPDGLLLLATVKRALNQTGQAEDAAQRYVARRPDDPRGAKLLATLQSEAGRSDAAAGTLARLAQRGAADAEAFDMLGRAHLAAGRPREAAEAFQEAAQRAPDDAGLRARVAAARLAAGDARGTAQAASEALSLSPGQSGARELLAIAALSRGDIDTAQAEWNRLDPDQRRSDAGGTLEGLLRLLRLDLEGARRAFQTVLQNHPETIGGRLGLARTATAEGNRAEAERLYGEVLRRVPGQPEALAGLANAGTPSARILIEVAHAAAPAEPTMAITLAGVLAANGAPARALEILNTEALRRPGQGVSLPLARSQLHVGLQQWSEAEQAARLALGEDPLSIPARRQLISLRLREGDRRGAEQLAQEALRLEPGNAAVQQLLAGVLQETQGLDAALAAADRMVETPAALPAALYLRGDLLLAAQRPADAARAFAAAHARSPQSGLAVREAMAWRMAGQTGPAEAALNAWLARDPNDVGALNVLAQMDLQAGRFAQAEQRLNVVVERAPDNAVALNNLAWIVSERGGAADLARARPMAERAFFLLPTADTADTLGWILARTGETQRALVLLRQAVSAPRPEGQAVDPGKVFRFAHTLNAATQRDEALRLLEPVLAGSATFPERRDAERLLAELRTRR